MAHSYLTPLVLAGRVTRSHRNGAIRSGLAHRSTEAGAGPAGRGGGGTHPTHQAAPTIRTMSRAVRARALMSLTPPPYGAHAGTPCPGTAWTPGPCRR